MKKSLLCLTMSLGIGFSGTALAEQALTPGTISYEMGGVVAERDVSLKMERDDEGAASFVLLAGQMEIPSKDAFMLEKRGATVAYIAFENVWSPTGEVTHLLFKGVKLEGENKVLYQGTLLKTTEEQLRDSGETLADCLQSIRDTGQIDEKWETSGIFRFEQNRVAATLPFF